MRIFTKKGKPTHEERKMKSELEKVFIEKGISEGQYEPANTSGELKSLYNRYVPTDAVIESETINPKKETIDSEEVIDSTDDKESKEETVKDNSIIEQHKKFIDPLLRAEKKVRDYVLDNDMSSIPDGQLKNIEDTSQETIAEPKTYNDSFGIPNTDSKNNDKNTGIGNSETKKEKEPKSPPLNPAWEDTSVSKKNKSTKKMAKWIVEIFCTFAEKGMILFGTKDINNTKLAEYASTQEIELGLILDDIGGGVQGSVRQFFENTCLQIEQVAKFSDEERQEISDALYEVLLEKGIAPNASQNLAIVMIGTLGVKVFSVYMLVKPVNSILEQLRAMNKSNSETEEAEIVEEVETEEIKPKSKRKYNKKKL